MLKKEQNKKKMERKQIEYKRESACIAHSKIKVLVSGAFIHMYACVSSNL